MLNPCVKHFIDTLASRREADVKILTSASLMLPLQID